MRAARRHNRVEVNFDNLNQAWELVVAGAKSGAFAGAVGLVSENGRILLHESCGFASIYPSKVLMRPDSIFDLASVTKAVATTTAILLLADRGAIKLHDKVNSLVRDFGTSDRKKRITIEHLLTHTSGLPAWSDFYARHKRRNSLLDEVCTRVDPISEPGTAFAYSDIGFILLGRIVEIVSGKRLDSYVRREITAPVGMKDTCFNPAQSSNRMVSTEYSNWRGGFVRGKVHDENAFALDGASGHAGLFSTADDLTIFAQHLLDGKILSRDTAKSMTTDHTSAVGGYVGLGWWIKTRSTPNVGSKLSEISFGHNGYTGTSLWIDPEKRLSITLLTNRIHPVREGDPKKDISVGIMMARKSSWGEVNRSLHNAVMDSFI